MQRLAADTDSTSKTVSTLVRNNESTSQLVAGAGLTGGGALNSATSVTFNVGQGTGILVTADAIAFDTSVLSSYVTGSGTTGRTPIWTGASALGDGKVVLTQPATLSTLTIADGKTLTLSNTLAFTGTDSTTHMFPSTSSSVARIDAAQTFAGVQTFSSQDIHNAGVSLGTSGVLTSALATDNALDIAMKYKPSNALTSSTQRFLHSFQNSDGTVMLCNKSDGTWEFGGSDTDGGYITVAAARPEVAGILFQLRNTGAGGNSPRPDGTAAWTTAGFQGAIFRALTTTGSTATAATGGFFIAVPNMAGIAYTSSYGGIFFSNVGGGASLAEEGGWKVLGNSATRAFLTPTNWYGGYVEATRKATTATGIFLAQQTVGATANFGLFVASATTAYKAIALGNVGAPVWIGWDSANVGSLNATTWKMNCDLDLATKNLIGSAATGTKILNNAAHLLGFWAAAPIAQPTVAVAAGAFVANTSAIANDTATFDGYTIGQIVKALRNMGLLA